MAIDWSQLGQNLSQLPANPLFDLGLGLMANGGAMPYGTTMGQRLVGSLGFMGSMQANIAAQRAAQLKQSQDEQDRQTLLDNKQKVADALQNSPYAKDPSFQALALTDPTAAAQYALKRQQQEQLTQSILGAPGQPNFTPPTPRPANGLPSSLPQETQNYVARIKSIAGDAPLFDAFGQPTAALLDAQKQVESGGNNNAVSSAGAQGPYQFMPGTAKMLGLQNPFDPVASRQAAATYDRQMFDKFGGNPALALAAYNAGPGTLQAAIQRAQAATQGTPAATQSAPATAQQNPLLSNPAFRQLAAADPAAALKLEVEQATKAAGAGRFVTMTPDQLKANNLPPDTIAQMGPNGQIHVVDKSVTGPTPESFDQLDPQSQALIRKTAAYEVLPKDLSNFVRPGQGLTRQQILGYAAVLNPDFNVNNADAANAYLKDMAKSSPTSVGGQTQSLNMILHHLGPMIKANAALHTSGNTLVNGAENAFNAHFRGNSAAGVAPGNWDQGKVFITQELGKLLKGGVASEGEVAALEEHLDSAGSPAERNKALFNVADYVQGKISTMTDRRDKLLGGMAPKTSLLDSESQRNLGAAYMLNGEDAPNMLPPGTTYATGATQPSTPAHAASPSGWSITKVQ